MKHLNKWFTLVELVIVAVILSILATVGFISYEEYITDTRDSKRLAQLTWLRDGLRLETTRGQLPFPDDNVEIRNNTTPFLYQWYAGANVLEWISYSEATIDPLDDIYYTYLLSRNRKDFQLLGFLEEYNPDILSGIMSQTNAVDYSQRYPQTMGKKLWILLQQDTNIPLQEIPEYSWNGYMDLQDTTTNEFDAYITDTYLISGKEDDLIGIIPFTTCKKIIETWWSFWNGIYNINPTGLNPFEVYCDMEMDGWWWTLVWRSLEWSTIWDFGWLASNGNPRDDSSIYSLGGEVININFSEIMLTTYSVGKDIELALKVDVDRSFIRDVSNYATVNFTSNCAEIFPTTSWRSACDGDWEDGKSWNRNFTRYWGLFDRADSSWYTDNRFHFRNSGTVSDSDMWLHRSWYIQWDGLGNSSSFWEFQDEQWMIFVR